MQKQEFSIDIRASKDMIWNVLWEDKSFRDWANNIDEGMYLIGALKEGAEVQFVSGNTGYGVTSVVEKLIPKEFVSFRHISDTIDGGRDERKREWTGGQESYSLAEHEGITSLTIALDTPPEQVENFENIFPRALERIKELSEDKSVAE